jgi:LysM repeat protein
MILSANRAKASAMYIKERITKPERINGRGYGESRPIVKCDCEGTGKEKCSEKENKMNRRTEFVLRKEGDEKYEDISTFDGGVIASTTTGAGNTKESKKESKKNTKKEKTTSETTTTPTSTAGLVPGSTKYRTDIPVTEEQAKNIANGFYIVNEGETLWRVYKNTGVPLADLRRINDLKSNDIKPGTKLLLK